MGLGVRREWRSRSHASVCVCTCVRVCASGWGGGPEAWKQNHTSECVCMHVCICVCTFVHMCVSGGSGGLEAEPHLCMCARVLHMCMCVLHVHECVHMCVHVCVCACAVPQSWVGAEGARPGCSAVDVRAEGRQAQEKGPMTSGNRMPSPCPFKLGGDF